MSLESLGTISLIISFVGCTIGIIGGVGGIYAIYKQRKRIAEKGIRIELLLSPDAYAALEQLQKLSGHSTLEETLRSAVRIYGVEQQKDGKMLVDCTVV